MTRARVQTARVRASRLDIGGNPVQGLPTYPTGSSREGATEARTVRRAQRLGQDALRRASATGRPTRQALTELGAAAGEMRRALHGNSRYTPPSARVRRRQG